MPRTKTTQTNNDFVEKSQLFRETSCSLARTDICSRLVVEKEKYAKLEEQFKNLTKEKSANYRNYFSALLDMVEFSFQLYALIDFLKLDLLGIQGLKAAYYFQKTNKVTFWVFFEERDWKAEDKVYDTYEKVLSLFPKYDIRIRVLRLWGRNPEELLPLGGNKIFSN
jgi:hypothetical protein